MELPEQTKESPKQEQPTPKSEQQQAPPEPQEPKPAPNDEIPLPNIPFGLPTDVEFWKLVYNLAANYDVLIDMFRSVNFNICGFIQAHLFNQANWIIQCLNKISTTLQYCIVPVSVFTGEPMHYQPFECQYQPFQYPEPFPPPPPPEFQQQQNFPNQSRAQSPPQEFYNSKFNKRRGHRRRRHG